MSELSASLQALLASFREGRRLALARAITLVEDEHPGFQAFLHAALAAGPKACRSGLTGPPGAGKSTLLSALAHAYRSRDERVGVVAVDPTSPFSGGALLGDRIRMNELATDPGIFIRSMATRGSVGGIATTTREVIDVMDAFGFEHVLVETVGVGQTELEITGAADTVIVVLVPESGDAIQTMKAGLMEIADIFVVNKADRPGADRLRSDILTTLHLQAGKATSGHRAGTAWDIPVLGTVAHRGEGTAELLEMVDAHRTWLEESGQLDRGRRARAERRVREVVERELTRRIWSDAGARERLRSGVEGVSQGHETSYSVARGIVEAMVGQRRSRMSRANVGLRLALAIGLVACSVLRLAAQEPLVQLDTLRVDVASRASAGFPARSRAVEVLTASELRTLPVRTVMEALQWVVAADVQPRSAAQADLSLRGSTFEQVLVLVDGVRMSDPQTGHFDLDLTVPLDRVERIEVLKGPASALYGPDAFGGVVNVVTREGEEGMAAMVEGGSFGTWRAGVSADAGTGGVRFSGSGEWERSDGHRDSTDYKILQADGRVSVPVGGGRLVLQVGHARRDFGAHYFYAPRNSYEETRTTTVSAGWSGEMGGGFTLHPRLSLRRHDDDFILIRTNPDVYQNVHMSRQRGGELLLRRRSPNGLGLAFALGGELYRDDLESDNVALQQPALGARSEDRGAAFAEAGWGGSRASVSAGLRADWQEGFGSAWSPSLSGSVDLAPPLRLRAAWGRSYRTPTWTDRYYSDPFSLGDPDLEPERSWSAEIGADLALTGRGILRVTAFRRESENLIDWVKPVGSPADAPHEVRNVGSATFDGLEVALEGVSIGGFQLEAGGSLLSVEAKEAAGLISRYVHPITQRATAGVSRVFLGERLLLAGWILHERRLPASGERGEPYELVGLRARLRLPYGEVDLSATNLTDQEYRDIRGNPAAARALRVAYRLGGPGG